MRPRIKQKLEKPRKPSQYVFNLSPRQLAAFLELARETDSPIQELLAAALDRYIERELAQCPERPN
jgi:hypothetical protein